MSDVIVHDSSCIPTESWTIWTVPGTRQDKLVASPSEEKVYSDYLISTERRKEENLEWLHQSSTLAVQSGSSITPDLYIFVKKVLFVLNYTTQVCRLCIVAR